IMSVNSSCSTFIYIGYKAKISKNSYGILGVSVWWMQPECLFHTRIICNNFIKKHCCVTSGVN
ncbi:MAG: hypothetical protein OXD32_01915, partial [Endozoicomonadaceae bacterium]|nr:hypothetical protein [Endozoicomonadaceae bacterium]